MAEPDALKSTDGTNRDRKLIFISYASADRGPAERLVNEIEAHGMPCWMAPRDVPGGANWGKAILDAIEAAEIFAVFLSAGANKSVHVANEIERAASYRKTMVPLRIENVMPSREIELHISARHWVDLFEGPQQRAKNMRRFFDVLRDVLRAWIAPEFPPLRETTSPKPTARTTVLSTAPTSISGGYKTASVVPDASPATRVELASAGGETILRRQSPSGQFFCYRSGTLVMKDSTQQSFNGFRGMYSDRLHYSNDADRRVQDYSTFPTINFDAIARINFADDTGGDFRTASVEFRNSRVLNNLRVAAADCHWGDFELEFFGTEKPMMEGRLSDPRISAVVFQIATPAFASDAPAGALPAGTITNSAPALLTESPKDTDRCFEVAAGNDTIVVIGHLTYAGQYAYDVHDGLLVKEGDGQTKVLWERLKAVNIFDTGEREGILPVMAAELIFVDPKAKPRTVTLVGGNLRGKTELGDYTASLSALKRITPVSGRV